MFYNFPMFNKVILSPDPPFTISGRENPVLMSFDRLLFEDFNGAVCTGRNRFCSRISTLVLTCPEQCRGSLSNGFGFRILSSFGSCLLVFGYCFAGCFFINPSKQPCLPGKSPRSVVSVKNFLGNCDFKFI